MSANAAPGATKLYSPRLLSLSAELADYPFSDELPITAEARSRTCGSSIKLGIAVDDQGGVARFGMQVSACAVGQSSASILARELRGKDAASIAATLIEIESWLNGEGALPAWPSFDALADVRGHSGRHSALLLPWKAAHQALSSSATAG